MKKFLKILLHPITVLVLAQISWGLLMFVWIRWYVVTYQSIQKTVGKINIAGHWFVLAEGCILMAFILVALYFIFVSQRRQIRLTKMQDSILGSVTHELKTPLASIRIYLETLLLYKDISFQDRKKFLTMTLQETLRLQNLIDSILISARLESEKRHLEFEEVFVKPLLEDSIKKHSQRYGSKRRFAVSEKLQMPSSDSLTVFGNRHSLSMLFDNLISNAAKYSFENGKIVIDFEEKKDALVFKFKDDGYGIEKSELKKIFKKFYRVDRISRKKVDGSGLGLFVCKTIVKTHGGKIYATSQGPDKGAVFYVELKRLDTHS